MIATVVLGLLALAVLAIAVGLFEAAQAPQWRGVARDRRENWERRQSQRLVIQQRSWDE
jgi:hypothetical protein